MAAEESLMTTNQIPVPDVIPTAEQDGTEPVVNDTGKTPCPDGADEQPRKRHKSSDARDTRMKGVAPILRQYAFLRHSATRWEIMLNMIATQISRRDIHWSNRDTSVRND